MRETRGSESRSASSAGAAVTLESLISALSRMLLSGDLGASDILSTDLQQLDLEDEGRVGRDGAREALGAVAQVRRDRELALAAHLHAQDALVPALYDHARAEREVERLLPVERAVELLTV